MGVGHVVLIVVLTVLGLGVVRRLFWFARWRRFRHHGFGGHHGWHRGHWGRQGGPGSWAARVLEATPEQEAKLSEIVARMRGDFDELRSTRRDLMASLAEMLPGEALDEQALGQMADKATAGFEKLRGDLMESLKEFHRTLTPEQRKRLSGWLQRGRGYRWA